MARIRKRTIRGPRGGRHTVHQYVTTTGRVSGTYGTQSEAVARGIQMHAFGAAQRVVDREIRNEQRRTRRAGRRAVSRGRVIRG